eukprot:scaffold5387_cov251-Ochromonas_danica.AAC.7
MVVKRPLPCIVEDIIVVCVVKCFGSVRACRSCYEQAAEQAEKESRSLKKKLSDKSVVEFKFKQMKIQQQQLQQQPVDADPAIETSRTMLNLQNRASNHLIGIVERLVDHSEIAAQKNDWKDIIVNLVKEVVSSVDPDVRAGDSLDIRPYVKIKIIPGGLRSESVYIDGVVFRKNVAHKKMAAGGWKENPRILLIASGIEFQRTDMKLSSMDTLIEQEDKFMEILVQKLMSLKPDIILVGRSVARKAQELLCEHNVIVMQNVKVELLERVARMTGAMVLPSTDNVVKQFGEECLGTCGQFWMRLVQDDPEKDSSLQPRRVLRTRISRGSTYAYIQGCPPERGCTIVLRGGDRTVLSQVKQILSFSIVVAYHLRLEVAYYLDRNADLPSAPDAVFYDDSSDIDDEIVDENITANKLNDASSLLSEYVETVPLAKKRQERQLLSTSLDIDYNLPFGRELIGTQLFKTKHLAKFYVENQQTLLITSLLMGEGSTGIPAQKSPADVKGIKYYTKHDIALGQFIIENCFQLSRGGHKEPRMLDQTLSFVHRPGRIDITVRKAGNAPSDENAYLNRDPHNAPLYLSSYCKDCGRVVTPSRLLSDETWKMSFGKFLEITFYNRSARCQAPGCNHSLRDSHILSLTCENYVAIFEFVPIHAYALHIRDGMSFPEDIHRQQTLQLLAQLPSKHILLMDEFRIAMFELEKEIKDVLVGRHEDLCLAMADVRMMESELNTLSITFLEDLLKTYECIPRAYADIDNENKVRNILTEKLTKPVRPSDVSSENNSESGWSPAPLSQEETMTLAESESLSKKERESAFIRPTDLDAQSEIGDRDIFQDLAVTEVNPIVALHFPATLMRNTFLRAMRWNTRIETIYRFLDSVRNMLLQQQQQQQQHSSQLSIIAPNPAVVSTMGTNDLLDTNVEADADYHSNKKQLVEAVTQDLSRAEEGGLASSPPRVLDSFSAPHSTKDSLHSPISLQPVSTADSVPSIIAQAQAIIQASESNPVSAQPLGLSSLYRAVLEQSRRTAEKPGDKMSRITKVLSRFLAGNKDNNADDQRKFIVPLGDFSNGRFGLKPGRNGEVIAVSEDVLASVIAYALASQEYYDDLQTSINENIDQMDADIMPQDMEPSANASEKQNISEMSTPTVSEKTVVTSAAETALNTLSLPFQKKKKLVKIDVTNNNLEPIPEEHLEEHDLDNEDADPTSLPSSQVLSKNPSTYGLNTFMEGFSSNNEDNTNMSNHADAAFGGSSGLFPNDFSKAADGITEVEEVDLRSPTSTASRTPRSGTITSPLPEWERGSDKSSVNTTTVGTGDPYSSADNQRSEGSEPKFESTMDNPIERQLTSQDKSNIRVRFDDYDDQGNHVCKFQCQVYRAKQFEALRTCYFHDEDCRENFIRSLAMTNRWVAQGGKSGAAFAKTSDERLVIKVVSRVELQMFLDFAPAYFGEFCIYRHICVLPVY